MCLPQLLRFEQDSVKYVIAQFKVLGTHIIGFWKKIMQNECPRHPYKVMDVTEERVPNLSDSQTPTETVDVEINKVYISLEHIVHKLVAVGTHIKGFWSEIVQFKNPKRPQNIENDKKEEVPDLYDPQTPPAIMDDNMCPFSEVNARGPDNNVQRDSSLKQDAAVGIYDNSNTGKNINSISEPEILSRGSFQIIPDSSIKCETSGEGNLNTEVEGDQQAVNFVPSTQLSKSDGSVGRVDSDGVLSFASTGMCIFSYDLYVSLSIRENSCFDLSYAGSFSSEDEFFADYVVL